MKFTFRDRLRQNQITEHEHHQLHLYPPPERERDVIDVEGQDQTTDR